MTPFQAVLWAALFNFAAFFIFKEHGVANTIAKTVKQNLSPCSGFCRSGRGYYLEFIYLVVWNTFFIFPCVHRWFCRAAIAHAGFNSVNPEPILKIAGFIFIAPMIGMIMAYIISLWFMNSFRKGHAPKIISLSIITILFIFLANFLEFDQTKIITQYDLYLECRILFCQF